MTLDAPDCVVHIAGLTFGSVPLVLCMLGKHQGGALTVNMPHLVVSVILDPSAGDSALNWIICPDDRGNVGL